MTKFAARSSAKRSPSQRLVRQAKARDWTMKRPKRHAAVIWRGAVIDAEQALRYHRHHLERALKAKAEGIAFRMTRYRAGLCRTWDDYLAIVKADMRRVLFHMRNLQGIATQNGFRIPG